MSRLWYRQSAGIWEEALPLGNGRLGAMVYGGADREHIQVNEESMWYGGPVDRNNPDMREQLPVIRKLIFEGRIAEAEKLIKLAMSGCPVHGLRAGAGSGTGGLQAEIPLWGDAF